MESNETICCAKGTMMIDLNELQFFVRICEARSVTSAAQRLGVPKSSVSRALTRLEKRLGVRLIERTTRSMALTEAGELYLERCMRMLDEAEAADLAIGALHVQPRGLLRVGTPVPFARFVLGPVLGDFLAAYPHIRLQIRLVSGEPLSSDGAHDIMIRPGPLEEDSSLHAKPIMKVRLAAYASPIYLAGRRIPEVPADLREHHCIAAQCGGPGLSAGSARWQLRRGTNRQEVRLEPRAIVADPAIAYQLALAGSGITLLNQRAVRADVDEGRLIRLLPDWEPEPVELYAVHASRLNASPKVRAFLTFLRERFDNARYANAQATSSGLGGPNAMPRVRV